MLAGGNLRNEGFYRCWEGKKWATAGGMPKGTRRALFAAETYGTGGEGACSRWAAQRPQTYHQGLSGGLRPAFRLLRSQREQAPSPQERFSGVARRSMHAVAPPLTSTSWRGNAFVARELAPAGLRSGPKPVAKVCQADCVQLVGCCAASGSKLPRHGIEVLHNGLIPPRHRPGNRRSVATSPRGWSTSGNARNRRSAPTGRLRPEGATGRTTRHSARRT
ncbi:hypothetical protein SAMN03159307_03786 [Pseudomonas sp. NFACC46-3]|nr:hypothetical protein SAMN03159307_03786 [Pseudomonas sp. NFACC46-3]